MLPQRTIYWRKYKEILCFRIGQYFLQWHSDFKSDRQSAELTPHGGWPRTARTESNINTVAKLILNKFSIYLNISQTRIQTILIQDLQMMRQCSTWVPHHLNSQQLQTPIGVCKEWLELFYKWYRDLMKRVIIYDKTCVYHFDPLSWQESSVWKCKNTPHNKKVRQTK